MAKKSPTAREEWHKNVFVSFRYPTDLIQSKLPEGMEVVPFIDGEEQFALVSIWYFYQQNARTWPNMTPHWMGKLAQSPDVHVHTYVKNNQGVAGIFCFKIWMSKTAACWMGRKFFNAPMYAARQSCIENGSTIKYTSTCENPDTKNQENTVLEYQLSGELIFPEDDSLEEFLTDKFVRRQYTFFNNQVNFVDNEFPKRKVSSIEIVNFESNLLQSVLDLPEVPHCSAIAIENTICVAFN